MAKMKGAQILVECLKKEGVDILFGYLIPAAGGPALGCPQGDALALFGPSGFIVRCLSTLGPDIPRAVANVTLPTALPSTHIGLELSRNPGFANGIYTFFIAATRTGTLEVLALGLASVSSP